MAHIKYLQEEHAATIVRRTFDENNTDIAEEPQSVSILRDAVTISAGANIGTNRDRGGFRSRFRSRGTRGGITTNDVEIFIHNRVTGIFLHREVMIISFQ